MFTGPNAGAPDPSITVTSRISSDPNGPACSGALALCALAFVAAIAAPTPNNRSEEHTSELQSRLHLVCRLLLEKKKKNKRIHTYVYRLHSRLNEGRDDIY